MERLTIRANEVDRRCVKVSTELCYEHNNCFDCPQYKRMVDRLAAYEDTGLEPEEIEKIKQDIKDGYMKSTARRYGIDVSRLRELAQADRDGRLVVLPCNPDSEVTLHHPDGYDYQADHWNIYLTVTRKADTPAGYKIHLLSIEEAEAVLKGGAE